MGAVIAVLALIAIMAASAILLKRRAKSSPPPMARVEYWIYTNAETPPDEATILDRILAKNPHSKKGPPVGTKEGILFSDVRFHIGALRRRGNALLFRPDLLCDSDSSPPDWFAQAVEDATLLIKVLFVSEEPVQARHFLQLVVHCADAIADLTKATAIYETESQRFMKPSELYRLLDLDSDGARFDLHVDVRWDEVEEGGVAFTRGMATGGLPDIKMERVPDDHRTLATFLVEESARAAWDRSAIEPLEINGFGEQFIVEFSEPMTGAKTHRNRVVALKASRRIPL